MRLLSVLSLALVTAACAADTDERPAEFAYIARAILVPSCGTATCHSARTQREGVNLSSVAAVREELSKRAFAPQTGDPADSELLFLLTTSGEKRMPVDSPLPQADIDLIETWIIAGAPR